MPDPETAALHEAFADCPRSSSRLPTPAGRRSFLRRRAARASNLCLGWPRRWGARCTTITARRRSRTRPACATRTTRFAIAPPSASPARAEDDVLTSEPHSFARLHGAFYDFPIGTIGARGGATLGGRRPRSARGAGLGASSARADRDAPPGAGSHRAALLDAEADQTEEGGAATIGVGGGVRGPADPLPTLARPGGRRPAGGGGDERRARIPIGSRRGRGPRGGLGPGGWSAAPGRRARAAARASSSSTATASPCAAGRSAP